MPSRPCAGRGLVERLALRLDVCGEADARVRPEHALEQALAVLQRDVEQRSPVVVEQVEGLEDESGRALGTEALLQQAEVRASGLVQRDDLAVDDRLPGVDPAGWRQEPREVRLGVVEVARPDPDRAVGDDRLDPVAVPLDLEQPLRVAERLGGQGREHRLDPLGQRRLHRAGQVDLGRRGRRLADPDRVAVGLDVVVGAAGLDALRVVLGVPALLRIGAALVDEQPLVALVVLEGAGRRVVALAPAAARPDDREPAGDLLAVQLELQLAGRDGGRGVEGRRLRLPGAPVPDDDVARAVLLRGDDALEVEILDGVVLDVDRHPAHVRVEGRALGDRPRHEDATDLEPEVVVETGGPVPLDDESPAPGRSAVGGRARGRLRRLPEVALAAVFLEGHDEECAE